LPEISIATILELSEKDRFFRKHISKAQVLAARESLGFDLQKTGAVKCGFRDSPWRELPESAWNDTHYRDLSTPRWRLIAFGKTISALRSR